MKYSDQGKKMKMAGGGVAEDMKPIGKNLGGLLKSPLVQAVSPAAMIYDKLGKENRGFMLPACLCRTVPVAKTKKRTTRQTFHESKRPTKQNEDAIWWHP